MWLLRKRRRRAMVAAGNYPPVPRQVRGRWQEGRSRYQLTRAEAVAARLLFSHLDAEQDRYLRQYGCIPVLGSKGNWYFITAPYSSHNVYSKNGRLSYCANTSNAWQLPPGDALLAQVLLIQAAEGKFLRAASFRHRDVLPA